MADELGDVELLAPRRLGDDRWARCGSRPRHGDTHDDGRRRAAPGAGRAARRRRPAALPGDARAGQRALLHAPASRSATALVEQALAMARRLGDDELLLDACRGRVRVAVAARHRASCGCELAREAMELADRRRQRAGVRRRPRPWPRWRSASCGRIAEMWAIARRGPRARRAAAAALRPAGARHAWRLPWLAMAGRFDEAEELPRAAGPAGPGRCRCGRPRTPSAGALITLRLWQGRAAEIVPR